MSYTFRPPILIWLVVVLLLTTGLSPVGAEGEGTRKVLILHSYGMDFRWTVELDDAVRELLEHGSEASTTVHSETLDGKYFSSQSHMDQVASFLERKYDRWEFDAVIVSDNLALEFARLHSRRLWPDTPLVFCGINKYTPELIEDFEMITGVAEELSAARTIENMRALFPRRRELHILSDDTATGDENIEILRSAVGRSELEVEVHQPVTVASLSVLSDRLDADDVAILVGLVADESGTLIGFERSGRIVAESLQVPVFSMWDFYMSTGIVGGYMSSGRQQGLKAAELTLRILGGEAAEDIPVIAESPNFPIYDLAALRRFGVTADDLPAGSIRRNEPTGLWDRYPGEILFIISAFLFLTAFALLAYEAARRRGARARSTAETLREKETLLREIHHRVKNNLQVVSSMLSLQSNVVRDRQSLSCLQDARTRIQSMALVHEHLYESSSIACISTREYVDELVSTVMNSMDLSSGGIRVVREVAEIPIDIDHAIPLGLVINELMSNALKYAYPHGSAGEIRLTLRRVSGGALLEIADDGPGLPTNERVRREAIGLQLVEALAGQLGGTITFDSTNPGLAVRLTFPLPNVGSGKVLN